MKNNKKYLISCLSVVFVLLISLIISGKNVCADNGHYITEITNPSIPKFGEITVTKQIKKSVYDSLDIKPRFVMTLQGQTVSGEDYLQRKILSFSDYDESNTEYYNDTAEYLFLSATFSDLDYGTYRLSEEDNSDFILESISSIEGGTLKTDNEGKKYVEFVINEENCHNDLSAVFTNMPNNGSVKVFKYAGDGAVPLKGVTFQLVERNNPEAEPILITTNDDGIALFEDVPSGEYSLTEVKTVKGYSILKDNIKVTLPMELDESIVEAAHVDTSDAIYSSSRGKYIFYHLTYEIKNSPRLKMPMTGGISRSLQYFLLMSGFMLIFAGIIYRRKTALNKI